MAYVQDSLKYQKSVPKEKREEEEKRATRIMEMRLNNLVIAYTDKIFTLERIWDICEQEKFSEGSREQLMKKIAEIEDMNLRKAS